MEPKLTNPFDPVIADLEAQSRVIAENTANLQRSIDALTTDGLQGEAKEKLAVLDRELGKAHGIAQSALADLHRAREQDIDAGKGIAGD